MSRTFRTVTTMQVRIGDGLVEREVEIGFGYTPGTPETGRTGAPENYDPGSPDEVEILSIKLTSGGREDLPPWLVRQVADSDTVLLAQLATEADETMVAEADSAAEDRADEARMEQHRKD